jgi:hypothetical protein
MNKRYRFATIDWADKTSLKLPPQRSVSRMLDADLATRDAATANYVLILEPRSLPEYLQILHIYTRSHCRCSMQR